MDYFCLSALLRVFSASTLIKSVLSSYQTSHYIRICSFYALKVLFSFMNIANQSYFQFTYLRKKKTNKKTVFYKDFNNLFFDGCILNMLLSRHQYITTQPFSMLLIICHLNPSTFFWYFLSPYFSELPSPHLKINGDQSVSM